MEKAPRRSADHPIPSHPPSPAPRAKSFRIGTAAWSLPKEFASEFPVEGSHLARYAGRLNACEINTAFYRDHQAKTYRRWGYSVPSDFRFSVKLAKRFTHEGRLETTDGLGETLEGIAELGERLGPILIQLPPSLELNRAVARPFFRELRRVHQGPVAIEPRHATWGGSDADLLLEEFALARVIADPGRIAEGTPSTRARFRYYRLHGSPVVYRSDYEIERLAEWRDRIVEDPIAETWCVFDNTTFGFATMNALWLADALDRAAPAPSILRSDPTRNESRTTEKPVAAAGASEPT